MKIQYFFLAAACAVSLISASSSHASIIVATASNSGNSSVSHTYDADVSSSDLLDDSTALATVVPNPTPTFLTGSLTDGAIGDDANSVHYSDAASLPYTATYNLDITTNTQGYDITNINSFAGYSAAGATLANQTYEIFISTVGNAGFTSLHSVNFIPFPSNHAHSSGASKLELSDSTGIMASNVDAIRFVFAFPGQSNGGAIGSTYGEVDVFGVASVPEPSSIALMLLGVTGLVSLRRRR